MNKGDVDIAAFHFEIFQQWVAGDNVLLVFLGQSPAGEPCSDILVNIQWNMCYS